MGGVWSSRSFTYYSSKSAFAFSSPIAFSRPMFLFSFWNGRETSLAGFSFSSPLTDLPLCLSFVRCRAIRTRKPLTFLKNTGPHAVNSYCMQT